MKNKFILIVFVTAIIIVGGFYFIKNSNKSVVSNKPAVDNDSVVNETTPKTENNNKDASSICDIFSKEEIASITGLNITSTKVFTMGENIKNSNCGYYINGSKVAAALSIGLYEGDASQEKVKYEDEKRFNGWRMGTDNRIPMEHFITYNEVQQLNDIYLIVGPDKFYRIALFSLSELESRQMIELAAQIATKISQ
jgi:uncharacterized protein (UPF0333 family)